MLDNLSALPPDPILGLMVAFREDPNPDKVDLGVGVYRDASGVTPILRAVLSAQARHAEEEETKSYIGPPGEAAFNTAIQRLIFGAAHQVLKDGRVCSAQTPGGCGALRVGAELIKRAKPDATVWVSDPTWANHVPLLGDSGLTIATYPYFDAASSSLRYDAMMSALATVKKGDVVLFHGCCHNPSGVDIEAEQWPAIAKLAAERGFVPFIDLAYQGLSRGIEEDALGVRVMAEHVPELLVASSCSKNFGLYRERVGAIAVVSKGSVEAQTLLTQLLSVIRGIYSMPPNHGGAIVRIILGDEDLNRDWTEELTAMRDRINALRVEVAAKLAEKTGSDRFDFIPRQRGMFSFLGIDKDQIARLREEFSIYLVDSSRINVAGLNPSNIDYFCEAVASMV